MAVFQLANLLHLMEQLRGVMGSVALKSEVNIVSVAF